MSGKILKLLILLAFVLLIVAISSFWFSGPSFREGDVIFELEGPTQITSGDEVVYKLKYSNETRSTLSNLDFAFTYPEGSIVFLDGQLVDDHSEDFKIEELASGEKGEKEFKAFIIGEKGSIRVAKAVLAFKAGNLSSIFEKSTSLSTTIINAPITLTLVAPPSITSGAGVQYILDYRNTSEEDASNLVLEFEYPDGFIPREYSSNPSSGNNIWNIKSLSKGSGGRITISGTISGHEGESKIVEVKLKRKIGDTYVDYQRSSAITTISNPVFDLSVTVNSSTNYSASLGDRLNYSIRYKNNSNVNFFGMSLTVKLEGDTYDMSLLDTRGGLYDDVSRTITWNPSVIPDFNNLTPNLEGKIDFNIGLKTSFPSAIPGASQDKFVKATIKFGTPNVPTGFDGNEVAVSESIVTKIGTQPTLNQSVYYNDSNFGFSGPFPMKVGEETLFTVHWQLINPGNDIDNVQLVSKLPPGIEWQNMTWTNNNLPTPTYNSNSGEIKWNFPKLPYGAGIFTDKYEASFRIKVRPSSQQLGSYINLADQVQFTGMDNFTKQMIAINGRAVSSNELADRPREGTVR